MLVRDVLRTKARGVIKIGAEATVEQAIARMVQNRIGSLPVVDGGGRLVGIFTERDVLLGFHNRGENFCRATIGDVMTRRPVTCDQDDDVDVAMGKMSDHSIGQLPVMSGDELVGVVSGGDVVKVLHECAQDENRHLLNYLYGAV